MAEFRMPSLGADMESGRLVAWHVAPGDEVRRGDIVAEVDTDKAVIDVETFTTGRVSEILVAVGERVPVGTPLALIDEDGVARPEQGRRPTGPEPGAPEPHAVETSTVGPRAPEQAVGAAEAPAEAPAAEALAEAPEAEAPAEAPAAEAPAEAPAAKAPAEAPAGARAAGTAEPAGSHVSASPLARRHAARLGVDLTQVHGSGPGGAVTTSDVEQYASSLGAPAPPAGAVGAAPAPASPVDAPSVAVSSLGAPPAPASPHGAPPAQVPVAPARAHDGLGRATPLTPAERSAAVRRAVATSMSRANREIPHYHLTTDVDMSAAMRWLDRRNGELPVTRRLLPAALLLKATAVALRSAPDLNGAYEDGAFHASVDVNLGVAVALRGGGLMAPAIAGADGLPLEELMDRLRDLVARVRSGGVRASELSSATVTVTNLGDQGVDAVLPVIYPPQVAIVGFGRIRPRPWVVGDALAVRPVVTATLGADHRVSDGHLGAVLLSTLDDLLQTPEVL